MCVTPLALSGRLNFTVRRHDLNEDSSSLRANMAHKRQSRPDSGLVFQGKVLKIFQVISSSALPFPRPPVGTWVEVQESQLCIHVGRVQYKRLDASVVIQDAPPDVTC